MHRKLTQIANSFPVFFKKKINTNKKSPPQRLSVNSIFTNFDGPINIHTRHIVILEFVPGNYLFLNAYKSYIYIYGVYLHKTTDIND